MEKANEDSPYQDSPPQIHGLQRLDVRHRRHHGDFAPDREQTQQFLKILLRRHFPVFGV